MVIIALCRETIQRIQEVRELRQQNFSSTKRLKPQAELIGLCGEVAWLAYLGFDLDAVFKHLADSAGLSDEGFDALVNGELIDFKTTASAGKRIYLNQRNPYSHRASVWALAYCPTITEENTTVHLAGWNRPYALRPHLIHKPNRLPALDLKQLWSAQLLNQPRTLRGLGGENMAAQ